jgi:Protein of unknown function (DUF4242)
MDTYVIRRRNGWQTGEELERAAAKSMAEGDKLGDVRWIRSYVTGEESGDLGTVCVYQAETPEALYRHATAAGLPIDEVTKVVDTVIVREDPQPATA